MAGVIANSPSLGSLVVPLAVAAAGIFVFFRWGLRRGGGQPIPPTCAGCGYDLSHRPAGSDRCSECGADLLRADAILTVRRRRRLSEAGPAAALAIIGVTYLFSALQAFQWRDWLASTAPLSWVRSLARGDWSSHGDVYRSAWEAREAVPSPAFYDHLLDIEGNTALPLDPGWASDLEFALERGRLTPPQRDRYLHQIFGPLTFAVRSRLRATDPLVVTAVGAATRRDGGTFSWRARFAARVDGPATLDHAPLWEVGFAQSSFERSFGPGQWCPGGVSPGHHRVNVLVDRDLVTGGGGGHYQSQSVPVVASATLDVDVLPPGAAIAAPRPDPMAAKSIARAVDLHVYHWHDGRVFAEIELLPTATDRAFRVCAVLGGTERTLGLVAASAGAAGSADDLEVPLGVRDAARLTKLTIVLVGDPDGTANSFSQTTYWPGRITYPDVPVQPEADYFLDGRRPLPPTTRPFTCKPGT
jgi:hypothetical protein